LLGLGIEVNGGQTSWQREFEDPIELPDVRKLVTLYDAAQYIIALPKRPSLHRSVKLGLRVVSPSSVMCYRVR
jgi:hypothetical protein